MENGHRFLLFLLISQYKQKRNCDFLSACRNLKLLPNFTFIRKSELKNVNWSPDTIAQKRNERLNSALILANEKLSLVTMKIESYIKTNLSDLTIGKRMNLLKKLELQVKTSQKQNDQKRNLKLAKLKNGKKSIR